LVSASVSGLRCARTPVDLAMCMLGLPAPGTMLLHVIAWVTTHQQCEGARA